MKNKGSWFFLLWRANVLADTFHWPEFEGEVSEAPFGSARVLIACRCSGSSRMQSSAPSQCRNWHRSCSPASGKDRPGATFNSVNDLSRLENGQPLLPSRICRVPWASSSIRVHQQRTTVEGWTLIHTLDTSQQVMQVIAVAEGPARTVVQGLRDRIFAGACLAGQHSGFPRWPPTQP